MLSEIRRRIKRLHVLLPNRLSSGPTVKLTTRYFGAEKANVVFGWIFAGHQLGAATAAYGAGLTRTELSTYLPAFFAAGIACIVAAVLALSLGKPENAQATLEPKPA